MSELKGYKGKIHDFLTQNKVEVGDLIKITSELTYSGILMPRYESGDESHIVLKLKSGYNIGIEFEKIEKIEKIGEGQSIIKSSETIEKDENLPKILLLSLVVFVFGITPSVRKLTSSGLFIAKKINGGSIIIHVDKPIITQACLHP